MKTLSSVVAVAAFGVAGAALAGNTGAGPAGVGSSTVGATVSTATVSESMFETPEPGQVGIVELSVDQAEAIADYLRRLPDATIEGTVITAPTQFQDGTSGTVSIDTSNNVLTIARS